MMCLNIMVHTCATFSAEGSIAQQSENEQMITDERILMAVSDGPRNWHPSR